MLLKAGGNFNTMKNNKLNNMDTPLHTAVEIESLEAIQELLDAGAAVTCWNRAGLTPLHVCVKKNLEEHLQVRFGLGDDEENVRFYGKVLGVEVCPLGCTTCSLDQYRNRRKILPNHLSCNFNTYLIKILEQLIIL